MLDKNTSARQHVSKLPRLCSAPHTDKLYLHIVSCAGLSHNLSVSLRLVSHCDLYDKDGIDSILYFIEGTINTFIPS